MNAGEDRPQCAACEQRILRAEGPRDALRDASVSRHLQACPQCSEFFESWGKIKPVLDRYRVPEPPEELIETIVGRTVPIFPTRPILERAEWRPARGRLLRVLLAVLVSLPLVILINALMGWALYEVAALLLPRTIALYCVGLFVVWASMAVSSGYASLPLLDALVRKSTARFQETAGP